MWEAADCKAQWPTRQQADQAGAAFAAKVGCGDAADVAACPRAVPTATLVTAASGQVEGSVDGGTIAPTIFALYPLARFPGSSPFPRRRVGAQRMAWRT